MAKKKTFSPQGARITVAWMTAEEILADGEWHRFKDVIAEMMWAGNIVWKTARNLLYAAVGYGVLERKETGHGFDTRWVRLASQQESSGITRRVKDGKETSSPPTARSRPRRRRLSKRPEPSVPPNVNVPVGQPLLTQEEVDELERELKGLDRDRGPHPPRSRSTAAEWR